MGFSSLMLTVIFAVYALALLPPYSSLGRYPIGQVVALSS